MPVPFGADKKISKGNQALEAQAPVTTFNEIADITKVELAPDQVIVEVPEKIKTTASGLLVTGDALNSIGRYFPIIHTGANGKHLADKIVFQISSSILREFEIRGRLYWMVNVNAILGWTSKSNINLGL